ncbi:MAG: hypothetical protein GAK43_00335 [Stenotrophomonas maltophilia]|nr:MAG: hypothetical protein GAK43_00335 [Stenotrophomonas maltophilia]
MEVDARTVHEDIFDIVHRHQVANAAAAHQPLPARPAASATLAELGIGSLQAMDVLFDIEDHFGFTFADNRAAEIGGAPLHVLLQATTDARRAHTRADAAHA